MSELIATFAVIGWLGFAVAIWLARQALDEGRECLDLASHALRSAAEVWDEGYEAGDDDAHDAYWSGSLEPTPNPYRTEAGTDA